MELSGGAKAEGFGTLLGRRLEDPDLAKVARTTSLSLLEPSSKGFSTTGDDGLPEASEGRIDEARVADAWSLKVFLDRAKTRADLRRGCLTEFLEDRGLPKLTLSPN